MVATVRLFSIERIPSVEKEIGDVWPFRWPWLHLKKPQPDRETQKQYTAKERTCDYVTGVIKGVTPQWRRLVTTIISGCFLTTKSSTKCHLLSSIKPPSTAHNFHTQNYATATWKVKRKWLLDCFQRSLQWKVRIPSPFWQELLNTCTWKLHGN